MNHDSWTKTHLYWEVTFPSSFLIISNVLLYPFFLLQLAYLPDRKREYTADDDAISEDSEFSAEGRYDASSIDDNVKFDKRNRRRGMLGWFKLRVSTFNFI